MPVRRPLCGRLTLAARTTAPGRSRHEPDVAVEHALGHSPQRLVDKYCPERGVILSTADANAAEYFERIPGVVSVTREESRYRIRGLGERFVTDVIRCLSENHVTVTDFRTDTSNLEDVFLKLTGHSIRD